MFLRMTAKDGRALASTNMHTLGTYATEHTRTYALKIINTTQSDLRTTNNFFIFKFCPLQTGLTHSTLVSASLTQCPQIPSSAP